MDSHDTMTTKERVFCPECTNGERSGYGLRRLGNSNSNYFTMLSERLIIVIGMAHSGTTVLTHVLRQHPDIVLGSNGDMAWLLECDYLPDEDTKGIAELLDANPGKRLLLKRPWVETSHGDWMARELPEARYLYCVRPFDEIQASWKKKGSFVDSRLRWCESHQRNTYTSALQKAEDFSKRVAHFRYHSHTIFLADPNRVSSETADWLGLPPFQFDVSEVGSVDIKARLRR